MRACHPHSLVAVIQTWKPAGVRNDPIRRGAIRGKMSNPRAESCGGDGRRASIVSAVLRCPCPGGQSASRRKAREYEKTRARFRGTYEYAELDIGARGVLVGRTPVITVKTFHHGGNAFLG